VSQTYGKARTMGVLVTVWRLAVRVLRSRTVRRGVVRLRARVDTPANRAKVQAGPARLWHRMNTPQNRARAELAAGRAWQRVDTPANQLRVAQAVRRLRSAGVADT